MERWVPCEESLPEIGQQVLAYRTDSNHLWGGEPVYIYLVRRVKYGGDGNGGVPNPNNRGIDFTWNEESGMVYWGWEMSHWIPVPDSPEMT